MLSQMLLHIMWRPLNARHDPNFAKKLAGQKGYMLQYDRMTDKEKLEKYLEFEKDLIIDPTERQKARISELEKSEKRIDKLESDMKQKFLKLTEENENQYEKYKAELEWLRNQK